MRGVLSIALEAKKRNRRILIVPLENAPEAAVVEDLEVFGFESLSEVVMFLRGEKILEPMQPIDGWSKECVSDHDLDFAEVKGQEVLIWACSGPQSGLRSLVNNGLMN